MNIDNKIIEDIILSDEFIKLAVVEEQIKSKKYQEDEILKRCDVTLKSLISIFVKFFESIAFEMVDEDALNNYELSFDKMNNELFKNHFEEKIQNEYYW